jgi:Domain of unknown function (DUF6916)
VDVSRSWPRRNRAAPTADEERVDAETVLKIAVMDVSDFTAEDMTPLVGTPWYIEASNGERFELRLTDVVKRLDKHVDARFKRDSFSLYFRGPREPFLPQSTYPFHHDQLGGPHWIFIVPNAKEADGFRYEAVFT